MKAFSRFTKWQYDRIRAAVSAPVREGDIVIASYNIRYYNDNRDFGKRHWFARAKYCLEEIGRLGADILCMQEVKPPQLAFLRSHLDGYDVIYRYRDEADNSEACPIFYSTARFTLLDSGTFWLSDTPEVMSKFEDSWHYRISTFVKLRDADGTVLTIFNVHPDYRIEEVRIRQLAVLADRVRRAEGQVIVTGDFNAVKGEKALEPFEELLRDSKDFRGDVFGATFNGFGVKPEEWIDFIYLPKDCTLVDTGIDKTLYNGVYPSDHYPIWAKVKF